MRSRIAKVFVDAVTDAVDGRTWLHRHTSCRTRSLRGLVFVHYGDPQFAGQLSVECLAELDLAARAHQYAWSAHGTFAAQ